MQMNQAMQIKRRHTTETVLIVFCLGATSAPAEENAITASDVIPDSYKAGYSTKPAFGGPNSPEGQLEEDDRVKEPAFRFPAVYGAFQPWRDWKTTQNEKHGFQLSGHYSTLYQGASEALGNEDKASSGVFRTTAKWTVLGRGTKDTGSIILMVDHRHAYRDIAPAALAGEVGYIGVTGTLYTDIDWAVVNFNWQQGFNDGNTGLLIGRYDPSDYMNILGYTNPWTSFSNLAILLDPSVTFGDSSWGVGAGHWVNDQYYVLGGINDANGAVTDDLEFFDGGSELYKWAQVGWSPTKSERYLKNVHLVGWHVDAREEVGTDSSQGIALAANWTFDGKWMPFLRAGWSEGTTPIYNKSATIGLIRKFKYRSDIAGVGLNWGDPPDDNQREQTTVEVFWNFQFAQNLAFTPSVQLLIDPALNPEADQVWITGLRARLTF
jgi:porin